MTAQQMLESLGLSPEGARAVAHLSRHGRPRYRLDSREGRAIRAAKREADQRRLDREEIAAARAELAGRLAH